LFFAQKRPPYYSCQFAFISIGNPSIFAVICVDLKEDGKDFTFMRKIEKIAERQRKIQIVNSIVYEKTLSLLSSLRFFYAF
jgi:hypothetical protein